MNRILDRRQQLFVVLDRLLDEPESRPCATTSCLYSERFLLGDLAKPASRSSGLSRSRPGRNAVAKVRIVQELCTYSSTSLLKRRTLARESGEAGISGFSGNASSR